MSDIIHRGETMLVSISAEDFPITDLSDVVLTIKHGHAVLWQCPKCRLMFYQEKAMCPNCGARIS